MICIDITGEAGVRYLAHVFLLAKTNARLSITGCLTDSILISSRTDRRF